MCVCVCVCVYVRVCMCECECVSKVPAFWETAHVKFGKGFPVITIATVLRLHGSNCNFRC